MITLCGKELPLRTNRELVQLLKELNGTSSVLAHATPKSNYDRFRAGPIPYNLTVYKSLVYFALTPVFTEYVLYNKVAITLYKFLESADVPEEHYYSTLFMIPGKLHMYTSHFCTRYMQC